MKTDTIFYTLLQNLPSVLFELLEQSPTLASHYKFSSVEIKELVQHGGNKPTIRSLEKIAICSL